MSLLKQTSTGNEEYKQCKHAKNTSGVVIKLNLYCVLMCKIHVYFTLKCLISYEFFKRGKNTKQNKKNLFKPFQINNTNQANNYHQ